MRILGAPVSFTEHSEAIGNGNFYELAHLLLDCWHLRATLSLHDCH
jgi:hypothetical protein